MTFLDLALQYAARNWYVFPCWPNTKKPMTANGFKDASVDPEVIRAWWTNTPDANIAIACGKSGLAVLDVDHGLTEDAQALLWMGRNMIPATYVVRTGRRPEFGLQFYFSGTMPDVGLFQLDGCSGQIKSLGGYVMAAGSIHPDTGKAYAVKNDLPLAPLPSNVAGLKKPVSKQSTDNVKVPKTAWTLPVGAGENRTGFLMEQTGAMRNLGCGKDAILARMMELNEDPSIISDPVDEARLEMTANNCARFPVPEQSIAPSVSLGKKAAPSVAVEVAEIEVVEELDPKLKATPLPDYPVSVWDDTLYLEFAKRASAGNFVPLEFFIEGAMTYAGSMCADNLHGMADEITPRMFTVLLAPPGIGKGTTFRRIRQFAPGTRLLTNITEENVPRAGNCIALFGRAGSEPGLNDLLMAWPHVILDFEELDRMMEKTRIDKSGGAFMSVIRTLFDDVVPGITTTGQRKEAAALGYLSLLGAMTPSLWRKAMEGQDSYGSGLGGRFNLIASNEERIASTLRSMDLGDLHGVMEARLKALQERPEVLVTEPDALKVLDEWWEARPTGTQHYNRVNVIVHRKALHLAWIRAQRSITAEVMSQAIRLGDYLVKVRDVYAVTKGEDGTARGENRVLHILQQIAPKAVRSKQVVDLLDGQMSRTSVFKALETLVGSGEADKITRKDGTSKRPYSVYRLSPN